MQTVRMINGYSSGLSSKTKSQTATQAWIHQYIVQTGLFMYRLLSQGALRNGLGTADLILLTCMLYKIFLQMAPLDKKKDKMQVTLHLVPSNSWNTPHTLKG